MSIGPRVVVAVALQEIDNPPHAQASAQRDDQGFHHINSGSKKCHMKYQNRSGRSAPVFPFLRIFHFEDAFSVPPHRTPFYLLGVRILAVIYFKYVIHVIRLRPELCRQKTLYGPLNNRKRYRRRSLRRTNASPLRFPSCSRSRFRNGWSPLWSRDLPDVPCIFPPGGGRRQMGRLLQLSDSQSPCGS